MKNNLHGVVKINKSSTPIFHALLKTSNGSALRFLITYCSNHKLIYFVEFTAAQVLLDLRSNEVLYWQMQVKIKVLFSFNDEKPVTTPSYIYSG